MDIFLETIVNNFFNSINILNGIIFLLNILILIFGKTIINYLDISSLRKKADEESKRKKLKTLQFINGLLAISYILALFINKDIFQSIILSGFTILIIYIVNNFLIRQIVLFYGKEIETNNDTYFQESPTSEVFSLVLHIVSGVLGLLIILNIFGLNSWLQAGGIIGGIVAFLGFTANNWAPDIISGLQLLHSNRITQGDVIKIPELGNNVFWIKTISLTEVKIIEIVSENAFIVRTSKFRDYIIENISTGIKNEGKDSFIQYIDLKIGYGEDSDKVEELCLDVFNNIKNRIDNFIEGENILINQKYKLFKRALNGENNVYVDIIEHGDHAIVYRMYYTIFNAKSIIKIRNLLNKELYKESEKRGIGLNTPLTISQNV